MSTTCESLVLTVEIIAGSSEQAVAVDLATLSDKLGLTVEANFNGIRMRAFPGYGWEKTLYDFKRDKRFTPD